MKERVPYLVISCPCQLIIYDVVHIKIGVGYLFLLCTGDYNCNINAF